MPPSDLLSVALDVVDRRITPTATTLVRLDGEEQEMVEILEALAQLFELDDERETNALLAEGSWGHYELLETLGSGAFGRVYRALDRRLEREVALKIYKDRPELQKKEDLWKEGRLLARVRHDNVALVYGIEEHHDQVAVVMELIEGETLAQRVEREGPLPPEEVIRIGIDVAQGLEALHDAGILHRDIKAENVICEPEGRAVLVDLGIGIREGEDAPPMGTPAYVAPEILEGEPATVQSDLYSFGVLLQFAKSNQLPSARQSGLIKGAWRTSPMVNRSSKDDNLDSTISRIISQCLSSQAIDRPGSVQTILEKISQQPETIRINQRTWTRRALLGVAALTTIFQSAARTQWDPLTTRLIRQGRMLYYEGNLGQAERVLTHAVKSDPSAAEAWMLLSWTQRALGRLKAPLTSSEAAWTLRHQLSEFDRLRAEGTYLSEHANYAEALESLQSLSRIESANLAETYRSIARCQGRLGLFRDAIRSAQRAADISDEAFDHGNVSFHAFRGDDRETFEESLETATSRPEGLLEYIHWLHGLRAFQECDAVKARAAFMRLSSTSSAYVGAGQHFESQLDCCLHRFDTAIKRLERSLRSSESTEYWQLRDCLLLFRILVENDTGEADAVLNKLLQYPIAANSLRAWRTAGRIAA
ncbi:MAG: serine/threonine-protein kinase, partial [Acidobacteriota bacterium]